jgi:hypothetical protein
MQEHSRQNIDADDVIGLAPEGESTFLHCRKTDAKSRIASRKNAGRLMHRRFFWGNGRARSNAFASAAGTAFISVREAVPACADE